MPEVAGGALGAALPLTSGDEAGADAGADLDEDQVVDVVVDQHGYGERSLHVRGHVVAVPSHMMWQDLDPVAFITDFADRIYHVDCKDTRMRLGGGRNGVLSSHLPWGDPRRGWDFVSTGRGDVPWEDSFRALAAIGYDGPISVEWEDAGMDRLHGAPEALAFLRRFDFDPPAAAFDAAFSS
ncbi:sugar phosphate isomerase/epimerase family protein [Nocardioides psychrotolerans]|uniref:AP endonuclease family 2 C terminus n=1 Tax=Nocardioides psychrotolerans TaxID=1005945 RepID=A0A1I3HEQ6_9ACTN|nr:sugar phosphate isomerase/epimerase [Nocardioides psychrotolerans]SFI34216.1 AP endonuclease family 2 C terminus [Nocardioides psychrotolerans]